MLSSVLNRPRAVAVNIEIKRAFVRLRQILASNDDLARRLDELEKKYDVQFKVVFDAIRQLMAPPPARKRRAIDFHAREVGDRRSHRWKGRAGRMKAARQKALTHRAGLEVVQADRLAESRTLEKAIRSNREGLDANFFLYCQMRHVVGELVHSAHGSVFDTITTRTFETTPVLLPDNRVALPFHDAAATLFFQVLSNLKQNLSLAGLRDALLPKLLSGEMRAKDAEKIVESKA